MNLTYKDIDYRRLLLRHYKYYKLSEEELVCLLCLDDFLMNVQSSVTSDDLIPYMNLSSDQIDEILASLTDRKFISYKKVGNKIITSLDLLYAKLLKDMEKDIVIDANQKKSSTSKVNEYYTYIEELIGRPLTGWELDRISFWVKNNIGKEMLDEAVSKLRNRGQNISVSGIDKILYALEKNKDINQMGTPISSQQEWSSASKKTKDILSKNWIKDDD